MKVGAHCIHFLPCNASFALSSSCSFCVSCTRICETDSSSTEHPPPVSSSSRFNISLTCFSTDTSSCRRTTSSCNSTAEKRTKRLSSHKKIKKKVFTSAIICQVLKNIKSKTFKIYDSITWKCNFQVSGE